MGTECRVTCHRVAIVLLFVIVVVSIVPSVVSAEDPQVEIVWGVGIALRDGVRLNATIYKPLEMDEPLPVVLTLTPYTSDTYHER